MGYTKSDHSVYNKTLMQKRAQLTRARILDVSTRLFSQNGYDATGVAEICAAASVSKGAFYHHFESKHSVFLAILDEWLATFPEVASMM